MSRALNQQKKAVGSSTHLNQAANRLRAMARAHAALESVAAISAEPLERRIFFSTVTLGTSADTFVRSSQPDVNFGASPTLFVQAPATTGDTRNTYLKFDISSVSTVNAATLTVNAALQSAGDPATTISVAPANSTTWVEGNGNITDPAGDGTDNDNTPAGEVTYNNQPGGGGSLATGSAASASGQTVSFDISSYVQAQKAAGNNTISLELTSATPSADYVSLSGAQLTIDNTAAAAPPTGTITTSDISSAGQSELVRVVYSSSGTIQTNTITTNNLTITPPQGGAAVNVSGRSIGGSGSTVTATYTVSPAGGGAFTTANNGQYTVALQANQVEDSNNQFATASPANFTVNVAAAAAPTGTITATNITTGSPAELVTVVYTSPGSIQTNTITNNDLTVTPSSGTNTLNVSGSSFTGSGSTVTAVYTVTAVGGGALSSTNNGQYTVALAANSVEDSNNQFATATPANFTINISAADTTAPTASIAASNITTAGTTTENIIVTYTDNVGINQQSIAANNLTVMNGSNALAISGVSTHVTSPGFVTATYTATVPAGGPFTAANNGNYSIALNSAHPVTDTSNNPATAGPASFTITVPAPDTQAPTATFTAPNVTVPGGTSEVITVVYTDNNAINAGTVDNASLTVTKQGASALTLATLTKIPSNNAATVTAVYTFTAPGGTFDSADNGTYTVTLTPNHVADTTGNTIASGGTTFTVNAAIPDTTPPAAVITAPAVTAPGGTTEIVTVRYTDNVGINVGSIGTNDLTATGPGGALNVTAVSHTAAGATVTATYTLAAPGGHAFNAADNGAYTVSLGAGAVTDTSSLPVGAAQTTFNVNAVIPDTTPPTATITAPAINSATTSPQIITVVYSDAGNVNAATLGTGNITVAGPSGALAVSSFTATSAGNSPQITVQYVVGPPAGGFTYTSNGTYSVTLAGNAVKDVSGNAAATQTVTFTVNIQNPGDPTDRTFNGGTPLTSTFVAESSVRLPSGQMLLIGHTGNASNGSSQGVIERLNVDGTADTTFGVGGYVETAAGSNDQFYAAAIDGSDVVVAGTNGNDFLLRRYDFSGNLDTSFGTNGLVLTDFVNGSADAAYAVTVTSGGMIVAGGSSAGNLAFAEYVDNGQLNTTFGQGGKQLLSVVAANGSATPTDVVGALAMQSDGKIVAAGANSGGVVAVRLNPNGGVDNTFGSGGVADLTGTLAARTDLGSIDRSEGLAIQADGKILVANRTASGQMGIARLDTTGHLDASFGTGGLVSANFTGGSDADGLIIQSGGQIIVVGTTVLNGAPDAAVAAFDPTGTPIAAFASGGQLVVGATGAIVPAEEHVGDIVLRAFGTTGPDGRLVISTSRQSASVGSSSTTLRLLVPGGDSTETFRGTFGAAGKKNTKLTFTDADGTAVTLALTNGSASAYTDTAGDIHLVITATAKGAVLTITGRGGNGRVSLSNVNVTGTLKSMTAKNSDLIGTLDASLGIGTLNLGNVTGGTIAASGAIGTVSAVSLTGARILSGANLGTDFAVGGSGAAADVFSKGLITNVKIAGAITGSMIAAGLNPGADGTFETSDDSVAAGSLIKSIVAKRGADSTTKFIAAAFKTANLPKKVNTATDPRFLRS